MITMWKLGVKGTVMTSSINTTFKRHKHSKWKHKTIPFSNRTNIMAFGNAIMPTSWEFNKCLYLCSLPSKQEQATVYIDRETGLSWLSRSISYEICVNQALTTPLHWLGRWILATCWLIIQNRRIFKRNLWSRSVCIHSLTMWANKSLTALQSQFSESIF